MNSPHQEEVVSMPIPVGALPLVTSLVDRYYKGEVNGSSATTPEVVEVPGNGLWTRAEIFDLYGKFRNPIGRSMIRLVAEASGGPVSYGQMGETVDGDLGQVRGQLAWFSKYSKAVKGLGKGQKAWPMAVSENSKMPKGDRYTYQMPPTIGRWWMEADQS